MRVSLHLSADADRNRDHHCSSRHGGGSEAIGAVGDGYLVSASMSEIGIRGIQHLPQNYAERTGYGLELGPSLHRGIWSIRRMRTTRIVLRLCLRREGRSRMPCMRRGRAYWCVRFFSGLSATKREVRQKRRGRIERSSRRASRIRLRCLSTTEPPDTNLATDKRGTGRPPVLSPATPPVSPAD